MAAYLSKTQPVAEPDRRRSLLTRLHAWWEGYDEAGAASARPAEATAGDVEGQVEEVAAAPEPSARVWTPERVAAVQRVCGEGCSVPGGDRFAKSVIKPLGLNETMSVLDYGCQLGQFARAIAKETGAWVEGVEPVELLAAEAGQLSMRKGVAKKAAVQACELAGAGIKAASRDAVVAVEALHRWPDPESQVRALVRLMKPGAQLLVIDFVRNSHEASTPNIDLWSAFEPEPPAVSSASDIRKTLKQAGLNVRLTVDMTADYCQSVTAALQGLAKQLIRGPSDSADRTELLREVQFWGRRLAVLQSGDVAMARFIAALPKDQRGD